MSVPRAEQSVTALEVASILRWAERFILVLSTVYIPGVENCPVGVGPRGVAPNPDRLHLMSAVGHPSRRVQRFEVAITSACRMSELEVLSCTPWWFCPRQSFVPKVVLIDIYILSLLCPRPTHPRVCVLHALDVVQALPSDLLL